MFCHNLYSILLQPAFYEAFGLTVVEAMTCVLPTFATCHGGPAEIIEHGISGFHIDPYHLDQAGAIMADFFERCKKDSGYWKQISDGGLRRIHERYFICMRLCGITFHELFYHVIKQQFHFKTVGIRGKSILKG